MYNIKEVLSTIRRVKHIKRKEFLAEAFDQENETFIVYITFIASLDLIHPYQRAEIASLKAHNTPTVILPKYGNFANVFSPVLVIRLFKNIRINDNAIKLVDGNYCLYRPIYSLK